MMPAVLTIEETWFGPAPTAPSGGVQPHGFGDAPTAPSRTSPTVGVRGVAVAGAVTVFVPSSAGMNPFELAWSLACWNACSPWAGRGALSTLFWLPWLFCRSLTFTVP